MQALSKLFTYETVKGKNKCDTVSPLPSPFEADRYMGTWYEIQHSSGAAFQPDFFDCTTALYYDLNVEAGTFMVHNTSTVGFLPFIPIYGVTGTAKIAG